MNAEAPRRARKQRFAVGLLTQEPESEAMPEVVGAVAVSSLIELFNHYKWLFNWLPFLKSGLGEKGMNIENLVRVVYGLFIILFLMFFPFGIAGVWQRIKRYLQTWPFSS